MKNFPTPEEPLNEFKFASYDIYLGRNLVKINRQTYSSLEFLGDVGGLYDGLRYGFQLLVTPFTSFTLSISLLTNLFKLEDD